MNLNDTVSFTPTKIGEDKIRKNIEKLGIDPSLLDPQSFIDKIYRQPDGKFKMPLWEFMRHFGGNNMSMTSPQFVVNNEIEIH